MRVKTIVLDDHSKGGCRRSTTARKKKEEGQSGGVAVDEGEMRDARVVCVREYGRVVAAVSLTFLSWGANEETKSKQGDDSNPK